MGLDMYLSAKKFVSGSEYATFESKQLYKQLVKLTGAEGHPESPSAEVSINIGYWRKANAIHGWFVRECGDGVDECQPIYVPRAKIEELRTLCVNALADQPAFVAQPQGGTYVFNAEANKSFGEAVIDVMKTEGMNAQFNDPNDTDPLRPTGGFFFGSTVKDEWYYQDLKDTVAIMDECLALPKEFSFVYQASW